MRESRSSFITNLTSRSKSFEAAKTSFHFFAAVFRNIKMCVFSQKLLYRLCRKAEKEEL